jgi:serine/threonine protein kinase
MPYYPKGSLKTKLANGFLTVREIVTYATQVLSGLHNIHSKGLVHFDIKPDNILISHRDEALIADFGLAKQTSYSGVVGQDRIYGKMIPPEGFNDVEYSRYFDIYQMGLTLHRMCKGDQSFYTEYGQFQVNGALDRQRFRHAVLNGQFPSRTQYPEHIPQRLIDTISQCLQQNPDDRIKSALDIVNAISDVDGNLLDWNYQESQGARLWTKRTEGLDIKLAIDNNGNSDATKTNSSGQVRRIRDYCVNVISRQQVKSFLRGF